MCLGIKIWKSHFVKLIKGLENSDVSRCQVMWIGGGGITAYLRAVHSPGTWPFRKDFHG